MNLKHQKRYLPLVILAICAVGGIWGIMRKRRLDNNYVLGTAQVYKTSLGNIYNGGGTWIDYIIVVNGQSYKASTRYLNPEIKGEGLRRLIDRTVPAAYDPSDPSISSLMLLPKDFKDRGYDFPDSLKWILPYLKDPPH